MTVQRSPTRRRRITADEHHDQLALWTARALLHTETFKYFLQADMEVRNPLDVVGLGHLKSERVTVAAARKALRARLAVLEATPVARDGVLFGNVAMLGDVLSLTVAERELLSFAIMLDIQKPLQLCFERLEGLSVRRLHLLLASVLGVDDSAVRKALARTAPLATTGLVRIAADIRRTWDDPLDVMEGLENVLLGEYENPEALLANFFRRAADTTLTLEDFPHALADARLLVRFLAGAMAGNVPGVNVLIYGAPGTGKTELARLVAHELHAQLYEVNVEGEDGAAVSSGGRFAAYQLCQKMLGRRQGALVLFDEIEDVFPDRWSPMFGRTRQSGDDKGWTNRLLEGNAVPTLWLSNEVGQIDPAFLRRFDYLFELRTPPQRVRRRILEKHLGELPARAAWIQRVSADDRLTPAHIERAVRVARLAGTDTTDDVEHTLDRVVANRMAVQRAGAPAWRAATDVYDLAYLNASQDLGDLVTALEKKDNPAGSMCLYGPPGTGKTAFAHHLAERLQRPLMARRASDILGPFVGQTEANLADMFRAARADGAVLLLDEADSFLQDRRMAHQNWEITQVNELLVQMEAFDGLFVCSTNLYDGLDQASLRRFTLKIRFTWLRPDQRWALFVRTLTAAGEPVPTGVDEVFLRAGIQALGTLTPGDFATVQRQARLLDTRIDPRQFLTALEHEVLARPGARRNTLGFGGP